MADVKVDEQYIAICPHYWGRGSTPGAAIREMVKAGGRKKNYLVKKCPDFCENPWVDGMGYMQADLREGVDEAPEDYDGKWEIIVDTRDKGEVQ